MWAEAWKRSTSMKREPSWRLPNQRLMHLGSERFGVVAHLAGADAGAKTRNAGT